MRLQRGDTLQQAQKLPKAAAGANIMEGQNGFLVMDNGPVPVTYQARVSGLPTLQDRLLVRIR